MRQSRVALVYGRYQRVDHLVLNKVRQVARRDRAWELTPAILDFLVFGEGVGDQGKSSGILSQYLADGQRRLAPDLRITVGQQVKRLGFSQLPSAKGKPQIRNRFIKEADPS